MEGSFSKVSLGFAEFVSQLLHETFDASLSAQNYQLEKYYELEKAANLSAERFGELYISDEELLDKEIDLLGTELVKKMIPSEELMERLSFIEDDLDSFFKKSKENRLKRVGFDFFKLRILEILVDERKNNLRELLNRNEMARLMIDSGEIKAKLELTNIYENNANEIESEAAKKYDTKVSASLEKMADGPTEEAVIKAELDVARDFELGDIRYKEILDSESGKKTLIINRDAVLKNPEVTAKLPGVRISATPAHASSTSNLYSEVTIKFKTV